MILLGSVLTAASAILLLLEVTMFAPGIPLFAGADYVWAQVHATSHFSFNRDNFSPPQVGCIVPLVFSAYCIYYGLFHFKINGKYALYSKKQTDAASLIFCSA